MKYNILEQFSMQLATNINLNCKLYYIIDDIIYNKLIVVELFAAKIKFKKK